MKRIILIPLALLCFACSTLILSAQDVKHPPATKTTGSPEHVVKQTRVQNAKVIHVSGHQIVVELENGGIELLTLPKDALFQIDGREMTVDQLAPGMKLTQEIHTVTTPEEVTTLRTIEGKVWHVAGPHVILAFPNGEHKQYTVPDGTVFKIDGKEKTVFDLRKGMNVSATVVTVEPQNQISTHTVVTAQSQKTDVPFAGPLLLEQPFERPMVAEATMPEELPKTASYVPLFGLLGLLLLGCYAGLKLSTPKT